MCSIKGEHLKSFIDTWSSPTPEGEMEGMTTQECIAHGLKSNDSLLTIINEFYHIFVICVRDKDVIYQKMTDGSSLYSLVTPSDAAFAALTYVDNYDGWMDTFGKLERKEIKMAPLANATKWVKVRGKTKFYDRLGNEAKDFYKNSLDFFEVVHAEVFEEEDATTCWKKELKEKLDKASREWWEEHGVISRRRKRKAPKQMTARKGLVQGTTINGAAFADYERFLNKDIAVVPKKPTQNEMINLMHNMADNRINMMTESNAESQVPSLPALEHANTDLFGDNEMMGL